MILKNLSCLVTCVVLYMYMHPLTQLEDRCLFGDCILEKRQRQVILVVDVQTRKCNECCWDHDVSRIQHNFFSNVFESHEISVSQEQKDTCSFLIFTRGLIKNDASAFLLGHSFLSIDLEESDEGILIELCKECCFGISKYKQPAEQPTEQEIETALRQQVSNFKECRQR